MEDEERPSEVKGDGKRSKGPNGVARVKRERGSPSPSPDASKSSRLSPADAKGGSESASTPDTGSGTKLSRKASQKLVTRAAPVTFKHLSDVTAESQRHFQIINDCLYGSKHMGSSEHDALDCDCTEEWRMFLFFFVFFFSFSFFFFFFWFCLFFLFFFFCS